MKRKQLFALLGLLLALQLTACGGSQGGAAAPAQGENSIHFAEGKAQVSGKGISVSGNVVTVSQPGHYIVSGKTLDGQLVVDVSQEGAELSLTLDDAEITNLSGPALHIQNGKDLKLVLAEGSKNLLVSGTEVMEPDGNSSGAALYAEDDMRIDGKGSLEVRGYINNGIACKNDLDIRGGNISVTAANNGVRGSDSVEIKGGSLQVQAANDGIKSTTVDKEGKGFIAVEGGSVQVTAAGDGFSAETELRLLGGTVRVTTTGNPDLESCTGLKANTAILMEGGDVGVNAQDHAMQCNGPIALSGGQLDLLSNLAKGIKTDETLSISGGALFVNSQKDGMDVLGDVLVSGGHVLVRSVNDAIQSGEANSGKGDILVSGGQVMAEGYQLAFNPRGRLVVSGGQVLGLSRTVKSLPGEGFTQLSWSGYKGDAVSLDGSSGMLELTPRYGYESLLVGTVGGPYELSDKNHSEQIG